MAVVEVNGIAGLKALQGETIGPSEWREVTQEDIDTFADIAAFKEPLVTAEWETEDAYAKPGRPQDVDLTGASVMDPVAMTVTILSVDITYPMRNLMPRRTCRGGPIKASSFLDLVMTSED